MNKIIYEKNYVVEDNIDFYAALEDSDDDETENICLISQVPLDENAVELKCGHKFNYVEIYNEVMKQKLNKHLLLDQSLHSLKRNEFLCPYCRTKHYELLPHIKETSLHVKYINGVNAPKHCCMQYHNCSYITKSGKNKGSCCTEHAFLVGSQRFCNKHMAYVKKQQQKQHVDKKTLPNEKCSAILKSGKRKGEQCGAKIHITGHQTCKRHTT